MTDQIPERFREPLNKIVNGQLDNYDVNFNAGSLKGENLLGEIVFVSLKEKNTNESVHLVLKKTLENLTANDFFKSVYANEIAFYEQIWPKLDKLQAEHSLGFDDIPKCFATCNNSGSEYIILEDLRPHGFKLLDKTKALDRQHYEIIFKEYAKFHAISCAYRELHPEEFSKLTSVLQKPDFDREKGKAFMTFAKLNIEYACSLFDPKEEGEIVKTLNNYVQAPYLLFGGMLKQDWEVPVLVHGDCWSNNMLFKYDEGGHVVGMKFLDFQMAGVGSPAADLIHSFYTGASKEVLDNLNDFLEIYINTFSETLEKLNCKPKKLYNLDMLKSDWKVGGAFGLFGGVVQWRTRLVDKDHIPDLSDKTTLLKLAPLAEEYIEQYNQQVKDLTTHLYENGYFNTKYIFLQKVSFLYQALVMVVKTRFKSSR